MKKRIKECLSFCLFCMVLFLFPGPAGADSSELPSLEGLPEVYTSELDNGIKILTIDDDLPRTVVICSIGFGRMYEDSSNAGISELIAREISIAGTKKYPGNELNRKLESVGGEISIVAGWENTVIVIKVLSRHTELAFDILGDILVSPVFSDEAIGHSRKLVIEKFRREMEEPSYAGFVKVREILFEGKGYGATLSEKSMNSFSSEMLENRWKRFVKGGNINIAVSSSRSRDELLKMAGDSFSGVRRGEREYYSISNEKLISGLKEKSGNIYLLPRKLEQATIITGTVAPDMGYSGNYSLFLMNYILGGGSFNSRLMNEIRVKRGLAYTVFSLVRNRYRTGVFMSFVQTRNEEAGNVLSLMKENIYKMSKDEVSEEELAWARESVKNSYVFNFAKTSDILENYLQIEYNNLDRRYYRDYLKNIAGVTRGDIKRESAALFGKGIVTVVVGERKLADSLKKYGNVVIIE